MRRDSYKAIATDSEGHELRVNDNVKEIDNEVRFYTLSNHRKPYLLIHRAEKVVYYIHTNLSSPSCTTVISQKMEECSSRASDLLHLKHRKATSFGRVLICPK